MARRMRTEPMMIEARALPVPSGGYSRASETTKPFDSEASEVTRASQFIQPVSNPTKSPNAVRAYRYAPPGSLKRSEEHTSELQSQSNIVCRLLLEKKKKTKNEQYRHDVDTH